MRSLAAVLLFASSAYAHDFWIEPSTFAPARGDTVDLQMKVGEHFEGELVTTDSVTIEGERSRIVTYSSRPDRIELEAAKFESYLREEGLEHVIEARRARGESGKIGTEVFSRSVKTLLGVKDEAVGLRLELVRSGDRFQVLFEGKPLRNALVVAIRRGGDQHAARSDAKGMVGFPKLRKGQWLVKTVHMVAAPDAAVADWESIWASLTFEVR